MNQFIKNCHSVSCCDKMSQIQLSVNKIIFEQEICSGLFPPDRISHQYYHGEEKGR